MVGNSTSVHLHTPTLWIGTHFLLTLETVVFLFHLLSATSKPFSSLTIRLAHAAHLGFFCKTLYINSLLLLLLLCISMWRYWLVSSCMIEPVMWFQCRWARVPSICVSSAVTMAWNLAKMLSDSFTSRTKMILQCGRWQLSCAPFPCPCVKLSFHSTRVL